MTAEKEVLNFLQKILSWILVLVGTVVIATIIILALLIIVLLYLTGVIIS